MDSRSVTLRAARAGLDPRLRLETWCDVEDLSYDRMILSDLTTFAFAEAELRRIAAVEMPIIDDFAIKPLDPPKPPTSTKSLWNATDVNPPPSGPTENPPNGWP